MYDFETQLNVNEEIIYKGENNKVKIKITNFFIIFFAITLFLLILLFGIREMGWTKELSIGFIVIILFYILLLFVVIKEMICRNKELDKEYYCITNERIFVYKVKGDILFYGSIYNFNFIRIKKISNNIGTLYFMEKAGNDIDSLLNLRNNDIYNAKVLIFNNVYNPMEIEEIANKARTKFIEDNNIFE